MEYMTFPWEQLGGALRQLSLSGSAGNVVAWILFLAIGSLPLIGAGILWGRHRFHKADLLLPMLAAALFAGLWFYVNPSYIDRYLSPVPTGGLSKYALASVIDSLLLTWGLLRFLLYMEDGQDREGQHSREKAQFMDKAHSIEEMHSMDESPSTDDAHSIKEIHSMDDVYSTNEIYSNEMSSMEEGSGEETYFGESTGHGKSLTGLRILLKLYALVLAVALLVQGWGEFRAALTALQENNSGSASFLLEISTLFLALQAVLGLLPGAAKIALLLMMSVFLHRYASDPFGSESCLAMERLRIASGRLLAVVLVANIGFNVLQLVFSRFLLSVNHQILFPLSEVIVILGIRTLSSLYLESKRLKEDNDMFI